MKIFQVTDKTQGQRENDFYWTQPYEIALFQAIHMGCDDPDNGCGCGRAFVGAATRKATTTVEVIDWKGSRRDLAGAIRASLDRAGFTHEAGFEIDELAQAEDIELAALPFDVGDVVERRGPVLQKRAKPTLAESWVK